MSVPVGDPKLLGGSLTNGIHQTPSVPKKDGVSAALQQNNADFIDLESTNASIKDLNNKLDGIVVVQATDEKVNAERYAGMSASVEKNADRISSLLKNIEELSQQKPVLNLNVDNHGLFSKALLQILQDQGEEAASRFFDSENGIQDSSTVTAGSAGMGAIRPIGQAMPELIINGLKCTTEQLAATIENLDKELSEIYADLNEINEKPRNETESPTKLDAELSKDLSSDFDNADMASPKGFSGKNSPGIQLSSETTAAAQRKTEKDYNASLLQLKKKLVMFKERMQDIEDLESAVKAAHAHLSVGSFETPARGKSNFFSQVFAMLHHLTSLLKEKNDLKTNVQEMKKKILTNVEELASQKKDIDRLEGQQAEYNKVKQDYVQKKDENDALLRDLKDKDTLLGEKQVVINETLTKIQKYKNELEVLKKKVDEMSGHKTDLATAQLELAGLRKEKTSLESEKDNYLHEKKKTSDEVSSLMTRKTQLETQNREIQAKLDEATQKIAEQQLLIREAEERTRLAEKNRQVEMQARQAEQTIAEVQKNEEESRLMETRIQKAEKDSEGALERAERAEKELALALAKVQKAEEEAEQLKQRTLYAEKIAAEFRERDAMELKKVLEEYQKREALQQAKIAILLANQDELHLDNMKLINDAMDQNNDFRRTHDGHERRMNTIAEEFSAEKENQNREGDRKFQGRQKSDKEDLPLRSPVLQFSQRNPSAKKESAAASIKPVISASSASAAGI